MWFTTSWDDGHPLDGRLAELMTRHGIAGTFYCPLRNAEGRPVLSASELRQLDGPFEIGSHTRDHAYATRMPAAHWEQQVRDGRVGLEDLLGHPVEGFCYPGGKLTADSRAAVARAGFRYARLTENFRTDCGADPLRVPTTVQFYPHPRPVLLRNWLRRGRWAARLPVAAACMASADLGARLDRALARTARQPDAVFHLWGHAWEIDEMGLWPQLSAFFEQVSDRVERARRVTNAQALRAVGLLT